MKRKMKQIFLPAFLVLLLVAASAFARSGFSGKVVKVADGDTITVLAPGNRQVKAHLYGIDCPEKKQAFGQRARQFTASRIAGQNVNVEILDTDSYGRAVGVVRTPDGGNLNRELLANGFAWVYTKYCKAAFCKDWKQDELLARQNRSGLWQDKAQSSPGTGGKRQDENNCPPAPLLAEGKTPI